MTENKEYHTDPKNVMEQFSIYHVYFTFCQSWADADDFAFSCLRASNAKAFCWRDGRRRDSDEKDATAKDATCHGPNMKFFLQIGIILINYLFWKAEFPLAPGS